MATSPTPTPPAPSRARPTTRSHGMPSAFLDSQDVVVDPTVTQVWRGDSSSDSLAPIAKVESATGSGTGEIVRQTLFREKYAIEQEIGSGGMGRVLVAFDRDLKRRVAMKVLATTDENREILRRFVEEAQISGQLEHPNLLPVHDVGVTDEGEYFFTMKLVNTHMTLRELIDGLRAGDRGLHADYPFERRVELIQHLCGALEYAHLRGVIHRDVKPENVMLDDLGEVYLLDWGIARLRHELEERAKAVVVDDERNAGTGTSYLIGTPAYMAPEQIEGGTPASTSDVYSLTAVLFELLTLHHYLEDAVPSLAAPAEVEIEDQETRVFGEGRLGPAAPAAKVVDILKAVIGHVPPDAESYYDSLNGRTPRVLSRVCRQGLLKDPNQRYASARELEEALRSWQMGCGPVVCPGTALQRGMSDYSRKIDRHPLLVPLLTYGGGGLFVLSWVFLLWKFLSAR